MKTSKKRKGIAAPAPDTPPEALDLAAHMKLLGDSFAKMGEIASEVKADERSKHGDKNVARETVILDSLAQSLTLSRAFTRSFCGTEWD